MSGAAHSLRVVAEPAPHVPVWRTKQQIADHLGVSVATIDRYRQQGMPFSKRSRGVVRFDQHAVDAWFAAGDDAA